MGVAALLEQRLQHLGLVAVEAGGEQNNCMALAALATTRPELLADRQRLLGEAAELRQRAVAYLLEHPELLQHADHPNGAGGLLDDELQGGHAAAHVTLHAIGHLLNLQIVVIDDAEHDYDEPEPVGPAGAPSVYLAFTL